MPPLDDMSEFDHAKSPMANDLLSYICLYTHPQCQLTSLPTLPVQQVKPPRPQLNKVADAWIYMYISSLNCLVYSVYMYWCHYTTVSPILREFPSLEWGLCSATTWRSDIKHANLWWGVLPCILPGPQQHSITYSALWVQVLSVQGSRKIQTI